MFKGELSNNLLVGASPSSLFWIVEGYPQEGKIDIGRDTEGFSALVIYEKDYPAEVKKFLGDQNLYVVRTKHSKHQGIFANGGTAQLRVTAKYGNKALPAKILDVEVAIIENAPNITKVTEIFQNGRKKQD